MEIGTSLDGIASSRELPAKCCYLLKWEILRKVSRRNIEAFGQSAIAPGDKIDAAPLVGGISSEVFCDPEETLWEMSVIKSQCRRHHRHSHKLLEASESFSSLISSLRFLLKSPPQRKQEWKILLLSDVPMTPQKTWVLLRAAGIKYDRNLFSHTGHTGWGPPGPLLGLKAAAFSLYPPHEASPCVGAPLESLLLIWHHSHWIRAPP